MSLRCRSGDDDSSNRIRAPYDRRHRPIPSSSRLYAGFVWGATLGFVLGFTRREARLPLSRHATRCRQRKHHAAAQSKWLADVPSWHSACSSSMASRETGRNLMKARFEEAQRRMVLLGAIITGGGSDGPPTTAPGAVSGSGDASGGNRKRGGWGKSVEF